MKLGIISDIHANLAALQAVLAALDEHHCVRLLCAGDIVGYGPSPLACIELVTARNILCVGGNHDAGVSSNRLEIGMHAAALAALMWTRRQLPEAALAWLRNLPPAAEYAGVGLVHASHVWRPRWPYILDPPRAAANFLFQRSLCSFHGHTHVPMLALHEHGKPVALRSLVTAELPRHGRMLINVGSVGQPRDGNPAAACAVFETRDRTLTVLRVPYDVADTQRRMQEAGLPDELIARLAVGG